MTLHHSNLQPAQQVDDTIPDGIDCETAALLRARLIPVFDSAQDWSGLMSALELKGFHLMFRNGRLALADQMSGAVICTSRFLGYSLPDLANRLGRPHIALTLGASDGVILH